MLVSTQSWFSLKNQCDFLPAGWIYVPWMLGKIRELLGLRLEKHDAILV